MVMKKLIILAIAAFVVNSVGYAETTVNTTKQNGKTTTVEVRKESRTKEPSLYDNIKSGWNKFINLITPR
jgi:hypothetical protein